MPTDLTFKVRQLMSEGKGDRAIAYAINQEAGTQVITRDRVRNLIAQIKLEDAKQGAPAETDFNETLRQDPQAWALRISKRWQASIDAIIQTGRLLLEAKEALPHGAFGAMIEGDLPFGARTAQMLMAIASDKRLSNPKHVSHLPASWGTLHALTQLSDEEFDRGVQEQIIRPDMERKEVEILRPAPQRAKAGDDQREPGTLEMFGSDGQADEAVARDEGADEAGMGSEPSPSESPHMPGGGLAIAHNRIEPSDSLDYFPTPPWATRALFERVMVDMPGPADSYDVWEPACGEGHMAEVLREYCGETKVLATDIFDYGYGDRVLDFLSEEAGLARPDWIISNPPFGDKGPAFVERALEIAQAGVAMFVRLQWLEGVGRYERIYRDQPPTRIAFFCERVPLHKDRWEPDGDTMTAYIWLVWIKGEQPRAPFWIPPGCRESLTRPDDAERFTQHPVARAGAAPPSAEAAE